MCATSYCVSISQDRSNHCPIKCRKPCSATKKDNENTDNIGERYPFEGTPHPICTCPICMCKCQFACLIKDVPELMNATRYVRETEAGNEGTTNIHGTTGNNEQSIQQSCNTVGSILGGHLRENMKLALSDLQKKVASTPSSSLSSSNQSKYIDQIQQQAENQIYETSAVNLLSKSDNIPMEMRRDLQTAFGHSTTVELPAAGVQFNTRNIMPSRSYANNNRLATSSNEKVVHKGMISNLEIDYGTTMSEQFELLRKSKLNLKHDRLQEVSTADNTANNTCNSIDSTHSTRLITPSRVGNVKRGIDNDMLASIMHQRVLKRTRQTVSDMVDDKLANGDDADKKSMRKKARKKLKLIEMSETDGQHVNNIMAVTANGEKLHGESAMCSQDVLARLEVLFSDEEE